MARLMVVIFGLMATGKTTLAQALGEELGIPVIHSDLVRKALAGLEPTTPAPVEFGQGIYTEGFSERTYAEMRRLAAEQLAAGRSVILDASYKRARERELIKHLAREHRAQAVFVYCHCPLEVVRERLGIRARDPRSISDGREELLNAQARDFDPMSTADQPLLRLDTGRELRTVLNELINFVMRQIKEEENRDATGSGKSPD